jgi:cbb3-type cytochrome oxidase subunit 3
LPKHRILYIKHLTLFINFYDIQNKILQKAINTIVMKAKSFGYGLVIFLFGVFGLIIYGAYSPARKAQKQQIVCYKFKDGITNEAKEKHMREFASLKHDISQIISYTSGATLPGTSSHSGDYDVMHYLTFQSEADIETYNKHEKHQQFVKENQGNWEKVLVINSDIRQ